ncbi:NADase-type glycan-binding domain-containing protein [Leptospira sp. 'Mane']|uniref:NADase-type glycan-binding domain-containing protein n=1 Tax=Leptospira sp. 'Mane' TaxID=3387407 RepID=UPI00398A5E96
MKYLIFLLVVPMLYLAARDRDFEKLYVSVNYCLKNKCGQAIASSFLIEKGKPKEEYSPLNVNDSIKETAWCMSKNQGIGEYIYVRYQNDVTINEYEKIEKRDYYSLFTIVNGFAKNKDLFLANNRVKRVSIEAQEIAYTPSVSGPDTAAGTDIYIDDGPLFNSVHEIELADTMEEQKFRLKIIPKSKKDLNLQMDLLFKIVIKEIYPGSKYKDTCISDASFSIVAPEKK